MRRLCGQLACVEYFTALHRTHLFYFERLDRYGLALSRNEFDLYCLPIPVAMHDRAYVSFL